MSTIQRLWSLLCENTRLLKAQSHVIASRPRSRLLDLPTEVLLIIVSQLKYENGIALSLTCHRLYKLLFKTYKPTPKHNGREARVLVLLERDLPDMLSCPTHERLYKWRGHSRHLCPLCTNAKRSHGSLVVCYNNCKEGFQELFEPERRLILRHALLGPNYGVPKSMFLHRCGRSHFQSMDEARLKIVGDSLMLWRTQHWPVKLELYPDLPGLQDFQQTMEKCHAMPLSPIWSAAVHHAMQNSKRLFSTPEEAAPTYRWTCPILFKCSCCSTDVKVCVEQFVLGQVVIRFDLYQDLGHLNELTTAQRIVFGVKNNWPTQWPSESGIAERFKESLELKYHGVDTTALDLMAVDYTATFLHEWMYSGFSGTKEAENIVQFWPDPLLDEIHPRPKFDNIPFHDDLPCDG